MLLYILMGIMHFSTGSFLIVGLAADFILFFFYRFLFNISDFVSDQALSLVGVSWFIAKPDEFTRYQSVTSGGDVTSLCAGQPNFATPCPISSATQWRQTIYQMAIAVCSILVLKTVLSPL